MSEPEVRVFDDLETLFESAAERVVEWAGDSVALSGGSTPKRLFDLLARPPYSARVHWPDLRVYWGDERCVPPDHPDSNYGMAKQCLLDRVLVQHVYRMQGEIDPAEAAAAYERLLPSGPLDLALQGMGPDGHTASLFPHSPALSESNRRVVANYVEKMRSWRITLTVPELRRARHVLFLITGADKAEALRQVLRGPYQPDDYPSQLFRNSQGAVAWYVDRQAAAKLE